MDINLNMRHIIISVRRGGESVDVAILWIMLGRVTRMEITKGGRLVNVKRVQSLLPTL